MRRGAPREWRRERKGRGTSRNSPSRVSLLARLLGPILISDPITLREVREPESEDGSGPRQLHDRLGFLAVPPLWGFPDTPQAQTVRFPARTHRYSESPYGISPARFPASICSAAWDRRER